MPNLFAMHMANELLSLPVAGATLAIAALAVAAAARRARKTADDERLPLMGVMGAFVFAAQMINFTLPGMPGTSGHLSGGVLLSILLGPAAGIVSMAAILIVQCLLFQDGGLLALGCNIINMGVVPCLLGWGLYRALLGNPRRAAAWRQYLAAWIACTAGVCGGAAMVPIEAGLSNVLQVPIGQFLGVMLGVHLLIGFFEGAATFAVVAYLRRARPELMGLDPQQSTDSPDAVPNLRHSPGYLVVAASILATALLLAGVGSWFASSFPDGLEWSYRERAYSSTERVVVNDSPAIAAIDKLQNEWSPMTDYDKRAAPLGRSPVTMETDLAQSWPNLSGWRSLAGVLGTLVTLVVLYGASRRLRKRETA
jgi:cobalt/nickel transport system permease protein